MLLEHELQGYQVVLRPITHDDLEQLRQWRNSTPVKQYMLTTDEITPEQQQAWFQHIKRAKNQIHFVIEYKQQAIGSCNIKTRGQVADIHNAEHFELGLYIGEQRYAGNIVAFAPTLLMNDYCFEQLKAKELHAVVKANNTAALRYNEKLGYVVTRQDELVELSLTKESYAQSTTALKQFLSRSRKG